MAQLGIHHPHRSIGTFMHRDAQPLVNGAILHAQTTTIEIGHSLHLRGSGKAYFRLRACHITLYLIQIIHGSGAGEDDIANLLDGISLRVGVIGIQIKRPSRNINRITEQNRFPLRSGKIDISPR